MFKSRPIFQSLAVTKPVVTQTTNNQRYGQYLSIETPWFTVLQIVWLLQLVKHGHFSKNQKSAENSQFLARLNLDFWKHFFKTL